MAQAVVRSIERHLDYEEEEVGPGLVGPVLEFLRGGGGREGGGAVLAVQSPLLVVSVVQETVWCQTPYLSSLVPAFISEIKQCLIHVHLPSKVRIYSMQSTSTLPPIELKVKITMCHTLTQQFHHQKQLHTVMNAMYVIGTKS